VSAKNGVLKSFAMAKGSVGGLRWLRLPGAASLPSQIEWLSIFESGRHGLKDQLDSLNNLKKSRGRGGKQAPPQKRRPLFRLRWIVRETMSKADGLNVDPRAPPRKGLSNCIRQRAAIEIKTFSEQPDIEEILHPAVDLAQ
jgi:hypothetical protein